MRRRKDEEVCGKPTQYNLQTLEYDWRMLPDSHIRVEENGPRIRQYNYNGQPADGSNNNNNNRGANNTSPQPLPAPSAPMQESYPPAAMNGGGGAAGAGVGDGAAYMMQQQPPMMMADPYAFDGLVIPPWSHEDIRRMLTSNYTEAQRSYLHVPRY